MLSANLIVDNVKAAPLVRCCFLVRATGLKPACLSIYESTSRDIPEEGRFRHEGVFPVLIEKEQWMQVQSLLQQRKRCAHSNRRKHRYAGILCCKECSNPFVPMIRCWNGTGRVEYICKGYQRYGKDFCPSHCIREEVIDEKVWQFLLSLQNQLRSHKQETARLQKLWALKKPKLDAL